MCQNIEVTQQLLAHINTASYTESEIITIQKNGHEIKISGISDFQG